MSSVSLSSEGQKVFIGKFIAAFSGIVGIIIYANVLGAAGLGLYYLSHAVATIASKPGDGIGISIEKLNNSSKLNKSIYASAGLIILLLYILFFVILSITLYNNSQILRTNTPNSSIVYLTILLFSFICIYMLLGRIYSGLGKPGDSVMVDAAKGIIETVLQILLLWYGLGVEGLISGTIIATGIAIIYLLFFTQVSFSKPKKEAFTHIKNFAKWSIITTTVQDIYIKIDTLLIGFFISPTAVGIYESAMRIIVPARYVSYAIKRPLLVRVSQDRAKNKSVISLLNKVAPYASTLAIPMFIGGIFVSKDLLTVIYGSEFSSGYLILIGGAFYYIIHTHSNVLADYIHGYNKPEYVTRSIVISSIIRITITAILLQIIGLMGIIPGIIIAETIRFGILYYSIDKLCNDKYKPYKIKSQIISSVVMTIVITPLYILTDLSNMIYLSIILIIGCLTYSITLINIDKNIRSYILNKNIKIINKFLI